MIRILAVLIVTCCSLGVAQNAKQESLAIEPPCAVTENSIFEEARICDKARNGSLTKSDVTVAGFTLGESTLEDVERKFPRAKRSRLTREEEAPVGLCLKDQHGVAVVFASGSSGGWKYLDSIFIAQAGVFEKHGVKCSIVERLTTSTKSGIALGMPRKRLLTLLRVPDSKGASFAVDYSTSAAEAKWLPDKSRPKGNGWVAMSGAYGKFRDGHLRWIVLYAGLSG